MLGPRGGSAESSLRQQGSLISPFSVSPSGSKPGREGSPHAAKHAAGQPTALARTVRAAPPTRGRRPLVNPLPDSWLPMTLSGFALRIHSDHLSCRNRKIVLAKHSCLG
jgi:hypothetical protein